MADAHRPTNRPSPAVRLGAAAALLLLEYLSLSFFFDAQTTLARGGVWALVGRIGAFGPLVVVGAAALLLVPQARLSIDRDLKPHFRPGFFVIHTLLAGCFFWCTSALFGQANVPNGPLPVWLGAWLLSGVGSALCLLLAFVGDLSWVLRALLRGVLVGGLIGSLGYGGGLLASALWQSLSDATFSTVHAMLSLVGFELQANYAERVLSLENFSIQVAPVCSGVEGLGLFLVLILAFLFQFRKSLRFPQAWLLIPIGLTIIWLGNAARIGALMIVGARIDEEMAIGSFHSKAGWVAFCAITIALSLLARRSSFFSRIDSTAAEYVSPATPLLLPLLTWIAIGMVTSAFFAGHDPLYGLRVLVCGGLLLVYRRTYVELLAKPSWLAWSTGTAVGIVWLVLPTSAPNDAPGEGWSDIAYHAWLALRVLGTVVIIPLVEELAFRGFLTRYLTQRDFTEVRYQDMSWLSIALSSVAFGLLHGRVVLAAATGVVYALVLRKTGKLIDPVAAHAASNAVIAAYVLSTGSWQHL